MNLEVMVGNNWFNAEVIKKGREWEKYKFLE